MAAHQSVAWAPGRPSKVFLVSARPVLYAGFVEGRAALQRGWHGVK
jgi:hypothetical protein